MSTVVPTSRKFPLDLFERHVALHEVGLPSSFLIACRNVSVQQHHRFRWLSSNRQIECKTGGGPVWSNNSITSVWSHCLPTQKSITERSPNTDDDDDDDDEEEEEFIYPGKAIEHTILIYHRYSTCDSRPDM